MKAFACRYGNQSLTEVEGWSWTKMSQFCAAIAQLLAEEYPDPKKD